LKGVIWKKCFIYHHWY